MATCNPSKYVGRDVVLQFHIGCGDTVPAESDWKTFGSLRTKEFTLEWETTDATADDSVGALRENLATFQTLSISGDGVAKAFGGGAENLVALTKHVAKPLSTGGQPFAWMRMIFPDLTFTAFMIISNMSRSAPHDDVVTFSLAAAATASDYGLIVEDTPNPDAPPPTDLEVIPNTVSILVGETAQLSVTVLPVNASKAVTWTSMSPQIATVDIYGVVTGVSGGIAAITATSKLNPAISNVSQITVA